MKPQWLSKHQFRDAVERLIGRAGDGRGGHDVLDDLRFCHDVTEIYL
jgi:hypothetical protein